ncbi:sensor histidine kinase [Roseixanthobacter pseudopolyaromaticivorans]|uniref:sensor histidine kinase n=1 Tax=Xanthobacteraceae TaxID=335928 RepID=UPI00372C1048
MAVLAHFAAWRSVAGDRAVRRLAALALVLLALVALDRLAAYVGTQWALSQLRTDADAAALLRVAVIRSEIEKQRTLPVVLAQDPDVRATLEDPDPARLSALDVKFAGLAAGTRTGAIYLLDVTGLTIAASNAGTSASFVGSNYAFRPYFRTAMADGTAEHFAFGTVSRQPGLYLTRRIDGPSGPLGVLVVKAEFEAIEDQWRQFEEPTFVTDDRAIVLISSVPDWRFRAIAPIAPERREELRASLQFGDATLDLLPIVPDPDVAGLVQAALPGQRKPRLFVEASAEVPTTGWTLNVLAPANAAVSLATGAARVLALLVAVLALGLGALAFSRRTRRLEDTARQAAARRLLEQRVAERTHELSHANVRLHAEMEERLRTQNALDGLKDDLVQASKLAVLGQIAASVAHEVNQPVAAIRTFAENSAVFLDRGDASAARANLSTIAALTDRIGAITGELRAFARKAEGRLEPVPLRAAIDGALLLVGHRLTQQAVGIDVAIDADDLRVTAERVRLEQVFVNLLQNALDALAGQTDGTIRIHAEAGADQVRIEVADNGPGLPPNVMEALFMPFTTTKAQGLGLGLVISHDIVVEFGGTLAVENRHGAVFTLTLPRAP